MIVLKVSFLLVTIWLSSLFAADHMFEELAEAIAVDDLEATVEMVNAFFDGNVSVHNGSGSTLLHVAAAHGAVRVLDHLLDAGINASAPTDIAAELPIHVATWHHHSEVVRKLLEHTTNTAARERLIDAVDAKGRTALCIAAQVGNVHIARWLMTFNDRPVKEAVFDETVCPFGSPQRVGNPLHVAVIFNQADFVSFLLNNGRRRLVNSLDSAKANSLHIAAYREAQMFKRSGISTYPILNDVLPGPTDVPESSKEPPLVISLFLGAIQDTPGDTIAASLLEKGADLEATDEEGRTPFLAAVDADAVLYARFLHKRGANVSAVDSYGFTAFHLARDPRMLAFLTELVLLKQMDADINTKSAPCGSCFTPGSLTPLQVAILQKKTIDVVRFLLQHEAEVSLENDFGDTAIHMAVKANYTEALQMLLEQKFDATLLERPDSSGRQPIQTAVELGNTEMARLLLIATRLQNGSVESILDKLGQNSKSSLHEAVVRRNYHAFKLVMADDITQGIDFTVELQRAIERDEVATVKSLLTARFDDDPDFRNASGWSLLHVAALYNAQNVAEFLLSRHANLSQTTPDGELPIHMALWGNSPDVLNVFLQHVGDAADELIEAEQMDGQTAIFYASRHFLTSTVNQHFDAADILIKLSPGCLHHVDKRGMKPIHEAVKTDNRFFTEYLVDHGQSMMDTCCEPDGKTAIHVAAEFNSHAVFNGPLLRILNETVADKFGNYPICVAANFGSVDFARKLFQASELDGSGIEELSQTCYYPPTLGVKEVAAEPVHIATTANQLDFIRFLVEFGSNMILFSVDSAGHSPLHVIALRGNKSFEGLADAIIGTGANIEARDLQGRTPFLFAAQVSALNYADYLKDKGAQTSSVDIDGYTAFHVANDAEFLRYLMQLQYQHKISHNINTKSYKCREQPRPSLQCLAHGSLTPLHVALLESKPTSLIKFLVGSQVNLGATNDLGQTPFHLAVQLSNNEALKIMLAKLTHPKPLTTADITGNTVLHLAVKAKDLTAMTAILSVDLERVNLTSAVSGDGLTPLHEAVVRRNVPAIELLLRHGARVGSPDAFGRTALRVAVTAENNADVSIFKMLLQHAANESALDFADFVNGDTALHRAVDLGLSNIVHLLLSSLASCHVRNKKGMTPLHLAVSNGFDPMSERLLQHDSCDPLTTVDAGNRTILESEVVQHLAPIFIEETILAQTKHCYSLARKLQLSFKIGRLHYAEILLKTMALPVCGKNSVAINHLNDDGFSAFHTTLILGNLEAAKWSLEHGADVSQHAANGRSAIVLALFGPMTEKVVEFTKNITDTLADASKPCLTIDPALKLVTSKRMELIRLLIKHGGLDLVNGLDNANSNTPLHYLAAVADVEGGRHVLNNGHINLDTNFLNDRGLSPLHLAALAGGEDAVVFMSALLDFSADPSLASMLVTTSNDSHMLALHVSASRCGNIATLDVLVRHVIHHYERISAITFLSRVPTHNGLTISHLAAKYHRVDLYMRMVEVYEYFRSWPKTPVSSVFTMPNVRAILPLPSGREAIVVCYSGDIVAISTDCQSVIWRTKVLPPKRFKGDFQGIYHAAVDSITKFVFFTFHHPMREAGIFFTTLNQLASQTDSVVLDELLPNSTKESQFLGIFIDGEREVILANDPWVNHEIAAYSMADGALLNRSSVHAPSVINDFEPLFCSLSRPSPPVANTDSGPRLLAVSSHTHRLHIFTRKSFGQETTFVATIASDDKVSPHRLGAIFYPTDLTFDHLGNLFVADYLNRRLQVFAAADLTDGTSLRAVWTTEKLRSEVQRIAVSVDSKLRATAIVGLENGQVLCFKHSQH